MKAILAAILLVLASGCGALPKIQSRKAPEAVIKPSGEVIVSGDAQTPAKVETKKDDTVLIIPEGSTFEFNEKLGTLKLVLSKATQMTVNRTETKVDGPTAFVPEKAPTPTDYADASIKKYLYLALIVGVAGGIFGLVRGWDFVMYGGGAIAGAAGFGLMFEKAVDNHPWITYVIVGGGVAAIAGVIIYFTKIKKLEQSSQNDPKVN